MHYGRARNVGRVRLRDLPEHKQTASDGASRGWEARLARAREQQHGRYGILSLLAGEVTTADLAKRVGKRNNTVRMALVALHAEGLVEKVGPGLWRRCG
jgi:predicted HTH transcriptional regulator